MPLHTTPLPNVKKALALCFLPPHLDRLGELFLNPRAATVSVRFQGFEVSERTQMAIRCRIGAGPNDI